ncbi:MAG: hypothetical protein BWK80_37810 [Desulfobacteraceae bacterium IS3]|jgi:hypothetical protein|nr:MAG: hypothetical protein BWK80_37810 [Desulfobacteraceae bacterium IS3]
MKKVLFFILLAAIVKMRRIIFVLCITGLAVAILPAIATAAGIDPGYDGYTYIYNVYTDPETAPWIEFSQFVEGQFSKAQLTAMFKGFPSQSVGKSDVYFMPDSHVTAVVYYNKDGFSTVVLLIFDDTTKRPA